MKPLDRPQLERCKRENVKRLALWLGLSDTSPEAVARHLAEQNMNSAWPPPSYVRRW